MVSISNDNVTINNTNVEEQPVIAFIGGGNMAEAILGGLYSQGQSVSKLRFSEPLEERRQYMMKKYPNVMATADNAECVDGADIVILAVKPQVLRIVVTDLASTLHNNPNILIISIAAGIESEAIERWLSATTYQAPIVRIMPNTPALIGEGAVGLYANGIVTQEQKDLTERLLRSVSKQLAWVDTESLIDTITGVSGSGPAYFFLIMEAMGKFLVLCVLCFFDKLKFYLYPLFVYVYVMREREKRDK